jgi:hypothetical protein
MGQAGFIATVAEPVAEAGRTEWLAGLRRQERQVLGRHFGNNRGKCRMKRDRKFDASLLLADVQHAIAHMLTAHSDHITVNRRGVPTPIGTLTY